MPLYPLLQSLQMSRSRSLQGQGTTGPPLVRDWRHLNDPIPGLFSRCGFAAPSCGIVLNYQYPSMFSVSISPPLHINVQLLLELAKRPFNVLSSRTYRTTPSAHPISFSILHFVLLPFWLSLKFAPPTHNTLPVFIYLYTSPEKYGISIIMTYFKGV